MKSQKRLIILVNFMLFLISGLVLTTFARAGRLEQIEKEVGKSKSTSGGYQPVTPVNTYDYYRYGYYPTSYPSGVRGQDLSGEAAKTKFRGKSYSLTTGFQYLYDTKGDLDGFTGSLRFRTYYAGLEGEFTRFREHVDSGNDYLNLYYCNLFTTLIREHIILDTGFGYTGIDGKKNFDGFGIACNLDVYPLNPLVLDLSGKGSLVHHTFIGDFRAGVGVIYSFVRFRISFRYIAVEDAPGIHGPEFGINLCF